MIGSVLRRLAGRQLGMDGLPPGVHVVSGDWIPRLAGRLAGMAGPAAAVTLGDTIVVHPTVVPSEGLLRHELVHVQQWRRNPLLFPLRYTWHHFRHGYTRNPFEVEARAAENAPDRGTS